MVQVWLLSDANGNTITTDNTAQKDQLLANKWTIIAAGARPEHSFLDELIEWEETPTKH